MPITTTELRENQVLIAARNPVWEEQTSTSGAPDTALSGVDLEEAVKSNLIISLREDVSSMTSRVTVDTVDDSATYTVTIDSNAVNYVASGGDDAEAILDGLASAINGDGAVSPIVTAVSSDSSGDGTNDVLVISGDTEATYTIAVSSTGSGVLEETHDADSCDVKVYLLAGGSGDDKPSGRWVLANGGEFTISSFRGFAERFITAGYSRMYVEILNVNNDGDVKVFLGPALID